MNFAQQLKRARTQAGLTQADVARISGVPQPNISAIERDRLTPRPETVERLRRATQLSASRAVELFRTRMLDLVTIHHGSNPRIFGSVARGEDRPGSDIDLLVDFDADATYFDLVGLRLDLEELLSLPVDVVHDDGDSPALERAREEAVQL
jgi:predicted nucleotidyltransferase